MPARALGSGGGFGGGRTRMSKSCEGLAKEVAKCLAASACVQGGGDARECLRRGEVEECDALRATYAQCRRGQLDARSRIRGNKGH